jgi:hypothetical protein
VTRQTLVPAHIFDPVGGEMLEGKALRNLMGRQPSSPGTIAHQK